MKRFSSTRRLVALGTPAILAACMWDDETVDPRPARYRDAVMGVMQSYRAPGVVAGVWVPGSDPWKMAFGVADVASGRALGLQDHFSIRSITKAFTVTVIFQLARDGILSLDDTIGKYVTGIPNGNAITLTQLAAMESGIRNYTQVQAFLDVFGEDPAQAFTEAAIVGYAIPTSPVFSPGAAYNYSNTNTVLLGMVIAMVTKTPLAEVFRTRIFDPLRLTQTSYPSVIALPDPHPTPYSVDRSTGMAEELPFISPTGLAGAGAIVSTLDDLGAWGEALGSGRLLTPAQQAFRLAHARPATDGPVYDVYGVGIGRIKGWWGHTGTALGFQAATFHHIERGATIAALVNATPASSISRDDNIAQDVFAALADVVT